MYQQSERERAMWMIHDALCEQPCWTAPYGVLQGMETPLNGRGRYRVVTFGVARYLDASVLIFSTNKIVIKARGALAYLVEGEYDGVWSVLLKLRGVAASLTAIPYVAPKEETKELPAGLLIF